MLLDRVGRRKLLLTGTAGLLAALLVLGAYFSSSVLQDDYGWLALGGLVLFIASFAIGLGPVFWLMISEIFPVGVRSSAMAICTIVNWGANFLVAQTFLTLTAAITRQGVFLPLLRTRRRLDRLLQPSRPGDPREVTGGHPDRVGAAAKTGTLAAAADPPGRGTAQLCRRLRPSRR